MTRTETPPLKGAKVKYIGPVPERTEQQRDAAVRCICRNAQGLDDARLLIEALGLEQ